MRFIGYFVAFFLVLVVLGLGMAFYISLKYEPEPLASPTLEASIITEDFYPEDVEEVVEVEAEIEVNTTSEEVVAFSPKVVRSVYLTSWSASIKSNIDYVIDLASTTDINAVVIDVKDYSGYVAYDTKLPKVERYKAEQIRLPNILSIIQRLHEEGIYVIARITVFQDPVLAQAREDLAVLSKSKLESETSTSNLWLDNSDLAWVDPASKEVWYYNSEIAREVADLGFDELNFDYVRFPSDGNLKDMSFPFWKATTTKQSIIRGFFKYLRQELPTSTLSVDLFGLSTVGSDDLGIGQVIEDGYAYFDYVCPMIYPSHYANGFRGYAKPAEHPYEVVKESMEGALRRLDAYKKTEDREVYLRPWLQDFNLGATYTADMVRAEIKGVTDTTGDDYKGFMLWNSWNVYTKEALKATSSTSSEELFQ